MLLLHKYIEHTFQMPRLTPTNYLTQHHQLKALWISDPQQFSLLSIPDQVALHKFYLLTLDKTDEELLAHRSNVKQLDPSLVNKAGKVYAKFMRGEIAPIRHRAELPHGRYAYVRSVMKPEPDVKLLTKALLMLAKEKNKEAGEDSSLQKP